MANATNPGSDYSVDIEGHVQLDDSTWVVQWALVWPGRDGWVGSPSNATELRVTVIDRGCHTAQVQVEVLSCSVPHDVEQRLADYVAEEELRQSEIRRAS